MPLIAAPSRAGSRPARSGSDRPFGGKSATRGCALESAWLGAGSIAISQDPKDGLGQPNQVRQTEPLPPDAHFRRPRPRHWSVTSGHFTSARTGRGQGRECGTLRICAMTLSTKSQQVATVRHAFGLNEMTTLCPARASRAALRATNLSCRRLLSLPSNASTRHIKSDVAGLVTPEGVCWFQRGQLLLLKGQVRRHERLRRTAAKGT